MREGHSTHRTRTLHDEPNTCRIITTLLTALRSIAASSPAVHEVLDEMTMRREMRRYGGKIGVGNCRVCTTDRQLLSVSS